MRRNPERKSKKSKVNKGGIIMFTINQIKNEGIIVEYGKSYLAADFLND